MHLMPRLLSIKCLAAIEPFKSEVRGQGTDLALCHGARVRGRKTEPRGGPGRPRSPQAEEVFAGEEVLRRSWRHKVVRRRSWVAQISGRRS